MPLPFRDLLLSRLLPNSLTLRWLTCIAGANARPPLSSAANPAATAHRQHDEYLRAFDGPPATADEPDAQPNCTGAPLDCLHLPAHTVHQPAADSRSIAAGAAPSEAARILLSADRNLLCASVDWERHEAVFGSADHACYTVDLRRLKKARTLLGKTAGHREWVAAVCHLPGGRIASGGLDASICVWPAAGAACQRIKGHAGPISQLEPVPAAGAAAAFVSASYDKRLITWCCPGGSGGKARHQQVLAGHRAPVLQLQVAGGCAASGDRDGALLRWDLAAGAAVGGPLQAHTEHCTALAWWHVGSSGGSADEISSRGNLLLSGGQDGCVRLWDFRAGRQVAQQAAHAGPAGKGAVGSMSAGPPSAPNLVVTAGADRAVRGLEARRNLEPVWSQELPDFPYSQARSTSAVLLGCGDGTVVALEAADGSRRFALAASASAVRTLHAGPTCFVAGCDDGSAMVYSLT